MYEKLVENWLTSVNELGYQLPFCDVLVAEGYTILYISRHGRGEHGKDVVARAPDGVLCTFQLKGGDIGLNDFRKIRDEIAELVQLPARIPAAVEGELHRPYLVTNGEIRGDAVESIRRYADDWERRGSPLLEVWERGTLLKKFLDAQGSFLPTRLTDFRDFVDLFAGPFDGPFPKAKFARLLDSVSTDETSELTARQLQRAIAALVLVAGYIVEQYASAGNHLAAVEGWVMTASAIFLIVERDGREGHVYAEPLALVRLGYERSLEGLSREALAAEDFIVPRGMLAEAILYGSRTTLLLGWIATWVLDRRWIAGEDLNITRVWDVFRRESIALSWLGEADWPLRLAIILLLDREGHASEAETMLVTWVSSLVHGGISSNHRIVGRIGTPSPYWSQELILRRDLGLLAPNEEEFFGTKVFTALAALDMLTRRMRRQAVSSLWPGTTKLTHAEFQLDHACDYFRWRTDNGRELTEAVPREKSWRQWRDQVATVRIDGAPTSLLRHPEWLLPFMIVYPHRADRRLTALADALIGRRARLEGV